MKKTELLDLSNNKTEIKRLAINDAYLLRKKYKIRFHHFHAKDNNRFAGTIATRDVGNGMWAVSACIVNENQGKGNELPPSRKQGRAQAIARLLKGNRDSVVFNRTASYSHYTGEDPLVFHTKDAIRVLSSTFTKADYEDHSKVKPKDIKVVLFTRDELAEAIKTRTIFAFFPGGVHTPALKGPRPFRPRKPKSVVKQAGTAITRALNWIFK